MVHLSQEGEVLPFGRKLQRREGKAPNKCWSQALKGGTLFKWLDQAGTCKNCGQLRRSWDRRRDVATVKGRGEASRDPYRRGTDGHRFNCHTRPPHTSTRRKIRGSDVRPALD